jgi:hypothetical protein
MSYFMDVNSVDGIPKEHRANAIREFMRGNINNMFKHSESKRWHQRLMAGLYKKSEDEPVPV